MTTKNIKKILSFLMSLLMMFSAFSISSSSKISAMQSTKSEVTDDEMLNKIKSDNEYLSNLHINQVKTLDNTAIIPLITIEDTHNPQVEEETKNFEAKVKEFKEYLSNYTDTVRVHKIEATNINKRNIDKMLGELQDALQEIERLRGKLDAEDNSISCSWIPNLLACHCCGLTKSFKCGLILGIVGTTIVAIIVLVGFSFIVLSFK